MASQGELYNLAPMLSGTLYAAAGALIPGHAARYRLVLIFALLCLAGVGNGVYLRLIELFAGIPSVVYGFWGTDNAGTAD